MLIPNKRRNFKTKVVTLDKEGHFEMVIYMVNPSGRHNNYKQHEYNPGTLKQIMNLDHIGFIPGMQGWFNLTKNNNNPT